MTSRTVQYLAHCFMNAVHLHTVELFSCLLWGRKVCILRCNQCVVFLLILRWNWPKNLALGISRSSCPPFSPSFPPLTLFCCTILWIQLAKPKIKSYRIQCESWCLHCNWDNSLEYAKKNKKQSVSCILSSGITVLMNLIWWGLLCVKRFFVLF